MHTYVIRVLQICHCFLRRKKSGLVLLLKFSLFSLDLLYPGETKLKMCESLYWILITMNPSVILLHEAQVGNRQRVLSVPMETVHGSAIRVVFKRLAFSTKISGSHT